MTNPDTMEWNNHRQTLLRDIFTIKTVMMEQVYENKLKSLALFV